MPCPASQRPTWVAQNLSLLHVHPSCASAHLTTMMPSVTAGAVGFTPPKARAGKMAILMAGLAAFGGFLYGYDTGYIAGVKAMPFWLRTAGQLGPDGLYSITTAQDSLVTSILSVGTFVGALLASPLGDQYGRKLGIIVACLVFSVGVALQTASTNLSLFVVGRVFAGLGVGIASCLVPMYQSECAPKWIRGGVVACYQWAITIGLLVASIMVNATREFQSTACYRIPIGVQFVWAAILCFGLMVLPESPRYLILKGNETEAWKSLTRLYSAPVDDPDVQAEFSEIKATLEKEKSFARTTLLDCFKSDHRKNLLRTLTGIGCQAFQQTSGINFFFYYGTTFFKNSGISSASLVTVVTNIVNVVMTIPGIWAVDKLGRRTLLIKGSLAMCSAQVILAAVGSFQSSHYLASQRVLVAFSCVFIGLFAATWGPIPWVVTSEIYPLATRGKQMAMSTASNWGVNFIIGFVTPYLVDEGPGKAGLGVKVFWIWAFLCFLAFLFSLFLIPETKSLSLEQVDLLYTHSSILKSNAYRCELIANNLHEGMTPMEKAMQERVEHI